MSDVAGKLSAITIGQAGLAIQEEPTAFLRWKGGILQQAWRITEWQAAMVSGFPKTEWRDVPSVEDH